MLVVYRHLLGESHPATGERPEGMLGRCSGSVERARSESGAAREQAMIGEVVEGFSQDRRGVHDDRLQRVHRRGARLHRGIPRALQLAHLSTAPSAVLEWPSTDSPVRTARLTVKLTKSSSSDPQDTGLEPAVNPPCWASKTVVGLNLTIPT